MNFCQRRIIIRVWYLLQFDLYYHWVPSRFILGFEKFLMGFRTYSRDLVNKKRGDERLEYITSALSLGSYISTVSLQLVRYLPAAIF